jgi:hypothetical protein
LRDGLRNGDQHGSFGDDGEERDIGVDSYAKREIGKDLVVDHAEEGDNCCQ